MKKAIVLFLMILMVFVVSCGNTDPNGSPAKKPVSGQIPSTDKTVLEGRSLDGKTISKMSSRASAEYDALEHLYDTVWFQTESDEDDGIVEIETEFLFFKKIGNVVKLEEKEMENGVMEKPDDDNEYETLTEIDNTIDDGATGKLNAFVAKNTEFENGVADDDEPEFEGYWLKDETTLYVIDGDTLAEVTRDLKAMLAMTPAKLAQRYNDDRYLLSEKSDIVKMVPAK